MKNQLTIDVVNWIKDFFEASGDENTKAIVGISGGKDSSIIAALCVEALGKDRVIDVLLPQGVQHDKDKALEVAQLLGIKSYEFNIADTVNSISANLFNAFHEDVGTNSTYYSNTPARVRMGYLYGVAALVGNARVANTCNRSEDYVGYSTKFGDSAGDFSPLSNLCVRQVRQIGEDLGLPADLVYKVPEDGLSGYTDEYNLGFTYDTLDAYLLDNVQPDDATLKNIEERHARNLHKITAMPAFPYKSNPFES